MDDTPDAVMTDYINAYQGANGKPVAIRYDRGWYVVGTGNWACKYRKSDITAMTRNLLTRPTQSKGTDT